MNKHLLLACLFVLCVGIFKTQAQCTAGFTYTVTPGGQTYFTSSSTGINTNTRYSWDFGNGNTLPNVLDTASYVYPYNGTYHVRLLIADSGFTTSCYDSSSADITVTTANNVPVLPADFTYTVSGGQVSFSLTNPSFTNQWFFGDGNSTSDQNNPTHNYSSNGTFWVTCYTQAPYSMNGIRITCDTFTQVIQVSSVPCHSQFFADSTTLANGGLMIHSTATGADSTFYSVNYGPHIVGNIYQNGYDTLYNLPYGNNTVCQYITGNACTDSSCQTVFVNCAITETHTISCGQVAFTSNSNQSITSAAWYINGSLVSSQASPTITFTNTSSFYVRYTLQSNLCQKTDSVFIPVGPNPAFYIAPDTAAGPHNWVVWVDNQPNYTSYTWNWGDGTTSTGAYPSHTYTAAASYVICVTITDNCGDSASACQTDSLYRTASSTMVGVTVQPQHVNNSGIAQHAPSNIKIYPVPANENLVIENLSQLGRAELYDNEGRKVLSESVSDKHAQISIKNLAPGFYLMKIYAGNEVWLKKVIKE